MAATIDTSFSPRKTYFSSIRVDSGLGTPLSNATDQFPMDSGSGAKVPVLLVGAPNVTTAHISSINHHLQVLGKMKVYGGSNSDYSLYLAGGIKTGGPINVTGNAVVYGSISATNSLDVPTITSGSITASSSLLTSNTLSVLRPDLVTHSVSSLVANGGKFAQSSPSRQTAATPGTYSYDIATAFAGSYTDFTSASGISPGVYLFTISARSSVAGSSAGFTLFPSSDPAILYRQTIGSSVNQAVSMPDNSASGILIVTAQVNYTYLSVITVGTGAIFTHVVHIYKLANIA